MAAAARARAARLHPGLPDEIFIWEILVRLPPKPLLRCRAVCRGWRRATSTRDFLLAHHTRQPSLPLLTFKSDDGGRYVDIMPLDHRAGVAAADQLRSVARFDSGGAFTFVEASCDGLLVLSTTEGQTLSDVNYYSVCNPATRQYAPLPLLAGFCIAGMYPHPPTGEYRLLTFIDPLLGQDETWPAAGYNSYVYALGSSEPPRGIRWLSAEEPIHALDPVLVRGRLHWVIENDESESCMIMVFDTIAELFRQMPGPAGPGVADLFVDLFEMDEMLGMASFTVAKTIVDIWMTQDYDSEVWAFKYRVKLPVVELATRFGLDKYNSQLVVSSWDDDNDLLILVNCGESLLHIDMGGKLVSSFRRKVLSITHSRLKQTLVQHIFFQTIEGYVVNNWPFISLDDSVVST